MRKFKLIKEYPGSPELDTIEEVEDNFGHKMMGTCGRYLYNISTSPEFWEEVVEKDYEILSFTDNAKVPRIDTKRENGLFGISIGANYQKTGLYEERLYGTKCWNIHSVKRLSDGEIFTIGDKIICPNKKIQPIEYIIVSNNEIWLGIVNKYEAGGPHQLSHINKAFILFKTEDGVEIYKGDSAYIVWLDRKHQASHLNSDKPTNIYAIIDNVKYFSTKEKAEEYVLMNKPCLSINDISDCLTFHMLGNYKVIHGSATLSTLKDLVKNKNK